MSTLRRGRLSVRTRLTLLCSTTVLGCGALMLIALYVLMRYVPTYEIPLSSPATPARAPRASP